MVMLAGLLGLILLPLTTPVVPVALDRTSWWAAHMSSPGRGAKKSVSNTNIRIHQLKRSSNAQFKRN